jgi:hypothetical protein
VKNQISRLVTEQCSSITIVSNLINKTEYKTSYHQKTFSLLKCENICKNGFIDQSIIYTILHQHHNQHISIRKLIHLYNNAVEGSHVGKSRMHKFITEEMNLRYRKPNIFHKNANNNNSLALERSFCRSYPDTLSRGTQSYIPTSLVLT